MEIGERQRAYGFGSLKGDNPKFTYMGRTEEGEDIWQDMRGRRFAFVGGSIDLGARGGYAFFKAPGLR